MALRVRNLILLAWTLLCTPVPAFAIPVLQLFVEGGTYDATKESWIVTGSSFRLWAIGNLGQDGSKGLSIEDVKLSVAYDHVTSDSAPVITLTPTQVGGTGTYLSVTDPSMAASPTSPTVHTDGSSPVLGDGSYLPDHGVYGTGTDWQEWNLGDFTLMDSPMGDFINSFPTTWKANAGQISAYDVTVSGISNVHFDLYDHAVAGNHVKAYNAPFSHDAEGHGTVPEPSSLLMLGLALFSLGFAAHRGQTR